MKKPSKFDVEPLGSGGDDLRASAGAVPMNEWKSAKDGGWTARGFKDAVSRLREAPIKTCTQPEPII
jgi:hypothetical protein